MSVLDIRTPEHLLSYSWLELEKNQALEVFTDLEKMIGKLDKKLTVKRVHEARVTLRRWYSVCDILAIDGWEEINHGKDDFEHLIGRKLRRLNKNLGLLRDLDVSLSMAEDLKINRTVVMRIKKQRRKLKKKVQKKISKLKLSSLVEKLRHHLAGKSEELSASGDLLLGHEQSAYVHLQQFLLQSEHQTRILSEHGNGNEELHELRLSIKRWRYLLTEFFGLTNLELVSAQQILGKIRDLNRLKSDIEAMKKALDKAVDQGKLTEDELLADYKTIDDAAAQQFKLLDPVVEHLPFGLRPYLLSQAR